MKAEPLAPGETGSSGGMDRTTERLVSGVPRRVHLLGVGGLGVSGLARLMHARGHEVSGCDREQSEVAAGLVRRGIPFQLDESPEGGRLPRGVELLVRSAAVPADDPRVVAAAARGIRTMKYSELLARVTPPGRTLGIAGTHGKTSTAWMTFHALAGASGVLGPQFPSPGAIIGGFCRTRDANAVLEGPGGWFVAEACEYDRTFLRLSPEGGAILNVEADHLDYYGSLAAIHEAFARYAYSISSDGLLVVGRAVPAVVVGAARCDVWRVGRELDVDLLGESRGRFRARVRGPGWATPPFQLPVPGEFQVENAMLALGLTVGLLERAHGVPAAEVAAGAIRGLETFSGVARRFESWGRASGVEVVHDYAHHPTELRVTLEAARRAFPGVPLHILFQPHQHSRTARFLQDFADSLRFADRVVCADVYGARRHIDGRLLAGSRELVEATRSLGVDAIYGGPLDASLELFVAGLPEEACALVLGAGDVDHTKHDLLESLALRRPRERAPRT